jgi:hypothetical protein
MTETVKVVPFLTAALCNAVPAVVSCLGCFAKADGLSLAVGEVQARQEIHRFCEGNGSIQENGLWRGKDNRRLEAKAAAVVTLTPGDLSTNRNCLRL